ncbi:unnamed protein product [Tuwongella immobilis]|uniref:Uncharacterized protein n=1 Tax=Tuwongella immobilis TaxID=692036 RepID=A0A6C2YM77_9BACT|nr:unnamed protein product [Tuwongella immobilis]VTS00642.1 unnamed protein product [Tuwongella immobilis]
MCNAMNADWTSPPNLAFLTSLQFRLKNFEKHLQLLWRHCLNHRVEPHIRSASYLGGGRLVNHEFFDLFEESFLGVFRTHGAHLFVLNGWYDRLEVRSKLGNFGRAMGGKSPPLAKTRRISHNERFPL